MMTTCAKPINFSSSHKSLSQTVATEQYLTRVNIIRSQFIRGWGWWYLEG